MSEFRRLLIAIACLLLLAACQREVKPNLPSAASAVIPMVEIVERRVYVPIDKDLTKPEPIAEGPIAQCFDVAAQRRAALMRANAKLKAVSAQQGTEVAGGN